MEAARAQLSELRQFVIDRKIVTSPSQEQARVAESPPYSRAQFRLHQHSGAIREPGVKATYYVAPPDPEMDAAERNSYVPGKAYLLFVSAHEVWPGHFLQSHSPIGTRQNRGGCSWDYAFTEGGRITPRK